jgi:hypothetical protein
VTDEEGAQWEQGKREALRVLRKKARAEETIFYSRFVRRIKAIDLKYHGDDRLDQLLDEISLEEDKAGRGLISALVVEVTTNRPSDGFYELAQSRHPPGTSPQEIFEAERDAVYRAHAKASKPN